MASRTLHLLFFFIFHIVVNTFETILAFIKGAGLIQCCHPLWGYMTIAIPFLPGIVLVPWYLWQACHRKSMDVATQIEEESQNKEESYQEKRGRADATWAIVQWLAFPITMFVTNSKHFYRLCHLPQGSFERGLQKIEIRDKSNS